MLIFQKRFRMLRRKYIFLFYPFFKTDYPQLANENFFSRLRFDNQFHLINIAVFHTDNRPDTHDIVFIDPVELTGVKHFVDIPQGSGNPVSRSRANIHQETNLIFQIEIGDITCPENNIFISSSEDDAPAILLNCTFHDE